MADTLDVPAATGMVEPTRYLLPPEAYHSPEWYEREQRLLFGRTWNLVAYEDDVPAPGDFVPVQAGAEPVLVVRGHDGELRAFLNMCRHRGMALACAAGHTDGNVRCPYHGWEFSPGGALERIPQRAAQFADVDPGRWGLLPVGLATWHGLVFVNPDPAAPAFADWLGDLPARFGPFDTGRLVEVRRLQVPIACNWKLYIENHVDVLHLWYLHDDTLGMYDHTRFLHDQVGPHWVSEERLRPGAERPRGLPPIAGLPADERDVLRANLVFPNVPTSSSESMWITYQVVPTGPETSLLDIRVRGEEGGELSDEATAQLLRVLRDEDGAAVERIQRVLRSSRFAVGPLATTHEAPITRFQRHVLEHLR
ncbi:MAG TPA: aromatic ring-hydroxylating dioxygenase subunit alpha [Acidimicrobiales bacterium]|nr:aromatic ring-hydroxylating dioxygenase subunit alpha [Acidimicrobiales bacterium]